MKRRTTRLFILFSLIVVLAGAVAGEIIAKPEAETSACTVRNVERHVVLYTIHRGGFDDIGPAVANLVTLTAQKGFYPKGPLTFVYLNNYTQTSSQHWLTEIRLPIDEKALELSGTLGEMTDVKTLSAMKTVVAVKPEGMADPSGIYKRLYKWMLKEGHVAATGPHETFLTNAESGDYAKMRTEIMVPIWEDPAEEN
jgi:effector-binding domain-containing protein